MNEVGEDQVVYEIGVVVPKSNGREQQQEACECVERLVAELKNGGLIVQRISGLSDEFLKLSAPLNILGKSAAELQMKKPTNIGMDLQFEWDQVDAFLKQPDGSLFSWCERFQCYQHLLRGIVNKSSSDIILIDDNMKICWKVGEPLLQRLESEGIVKLVFPLHDEIKRKKLLKSWALNWWDMTEQPIDEVYSYYGTKVAVYFAFLGRYTHWMLFPAGFALIVQLVDFGPFQLLVLPIFFVSIILWAVFFFQFWKRKNAALLARWQINYTAWNFRQPPVDLIKNPGMDKAKEKQLYQKYEWLGYFKRFRNDTIVVLSIICLQLPFELAYAYLYEVFKNDILRFGLTAAYLVIIQNFTKIGGRISVKLIKYETNETTELRANSLVYKVFGLYFMQTYIGIFYHALLYRNFMTLRKLLIQRLIISEVLDNILENAIPYLKYSYKKYSAIRNKKKCDKGSSSEKINFSSRVEKEYLKATYTASIGMEIEDGLFDDFLELALQFGMIMMFACAFPLAFVFATVNNITEIRTDAFKLLTMLKRPAPNASTTIGAWFQIFQFLIVMSIVTNSALLVWFYDSEGKWKIEPGLAAILVMEHVLLLFKFGFSRFVPEEPAWVRANRLRNTSQAQYMCSKRLLREACEELKQEAIKTNGCSPCSS